MTETTNRTDAPVAKRVPTTRVKHGDEVVDEYAWLLDRDDPDTEAYLSAENEYCDARTAHLAGLQETIFGEIKSRTKETDLSVPVRRGDWWYYSRTEEGKQYGIHCRSEAETGGTEHVLLDGNELAGDSDYFAVGVFSVTPDGRLLAYATDYDGSEKYTLRFRDLSTGETLPDVIEGVYYGGAWSADGSTFFYTTLDDAMRPYRVWRHRLGTGQDDDQLVHQEDDERFFVGVTLTRSKAYLLLYAGSKVTTEVRYLAADDPMGEFQVFEERRQGVEYDVQHAGDWFYVMHNGGAENFTLARTPAGATGRAHWEPVVRHRADTRLEDVAAFRSHLVVGLRKDGLTGLRVFPIEGGKLGEPHDVAFEEPVYTVHGGGNPEFDTSTFRYVYASMVTPASVYDYHVASREHELKKRTPVLGDFDPDAYESAREWATAADGTLVPISLVWRQGTPRDGTAPCLLYGYGSYEHSTDPYFSIPRLSLLDRGFVFAIAHIRGGGEMGRQWYEQGKLAQKRNTFTDFVACADHLVAQHWTAYDRIVARGGSAGGLLVGAAANLAPEKFRGILAHVPFVDALNTILDPSLPLTVIEWEEWGNPVESAEMYEYMKSYSPYENVTAQAYPAIFATAGLNDPRVGYHEPAKWVARLRTTKTDDNELLLKTEMGAGHGGKSGRYDSWRDEGLYLAWAIDLVGANG
ncbi:MAG: prolyl oligopeptidase family serine peptidase [Streptosporangiales bacterium]|nr:prolyl oligopeptidase family serine peptidase [Streptosporangiales bacterium]